MDGRAQSCRATGLRRLDRGLARVRHYIGELERVVAAFDGEQFRREQLHADELARRDRLLLDKDAEIARIEQENRRLRETSGLTSRNSSKPPSSDPPSAPKRVPKKPSGYVAE